MKKTILVLATVFILRGNVFGADWGLVAQQCEDADVPFLYILKFSGVEQLGGCCDNMEYCIGGMSVNDRWVLLVAEGVNSWKNFYEWSMPGIITSGISYGSADNWQYFYGLNFQMTLQDGQMYLSATSGIGTFNSLAFFSGSSTAIWNGQVDNLYTTARVLPVWDTSGCPAGLDNMGRPRMFVVGLNGGVEWHGFGVHDVPDIENLTAEKLLSLINFTQYQKVTNINCLKRFAESWLNYQVEEFDCNE